MKCPNGYLEKLMSPLKICEWGLGSKLDEGEDGYIVHACCGNECKYIVKVIENKHQRSNFLQKVSKEIAMQSEFASLGLAPKILDAWMCNSEASIVMEKKDTNLVRLVQALVSQNKSQQEILRTIDALQDATLALVKKAHQNNLVHKDLHLKNVMVDVDEDLDWFNLKLVDFGKSTKVRSESEANSEEPIAEIKLSFDMLRRTAMGMNAIAKSPPRAPKKKQREEASSYKRPMSPMRSPIKSTPLFSPALSPSPVKIKSSARSLFDSPSTPKSPRGNVRQLSYDDSDDEDNFMVKRSLF